FYATNRNQMPSLHVPLEVSVWFDALICPLRAQVTLYRVSACSRQTWTVRPINSADGYSQSQSANPARLSLYLHASEIAITFVKTGLDWEENSRRKVLRLIEQNQGTPI